MSSQSDTPVVRTLAGLESAAPGSLVVVEDPLVVRRFSLRQLVRLTDDLVVVSDGGDRAFCRDTLRCSSSSLLGSGRILLDDYPVLGPSGSRVSVDEALADIGLWDEIPRARALMVGVGHALQRSDADSVRELSDFLSRWMSDHLVRIPDKLGSG